MKRTNKYLERNIEKRRHTSTRTEREREVQRQRDKKTYVALTNCGLLGYERVRGDKLCAPTLSLFMQ